MKQKDIIKGRLWYYNDWRYGKWFMIGGDEYFRKTLLIRIPFGGALVLALKECKCIDCEFMKLNDPLFLRWKSIQESTKA